MAKKESTTQHPKEEATKNQESPSTPTPSLSEETGELPLEKPTKLTVVNSVQFLQPTEVKPISPGSSYQQVSRLQCRILEFPEYLMLYPIDQRNKFTMKVPKSATKGITYETVDPSELVQS